MDPTDLRKKLFRAANAPAPSPDQLVVPNSSEDNGHTPVSWEPYFDERQVVSIAGTQNRFVVYTSLRCNGPLFVFHHGAGHGALAFALVAQLIRQRYPVEISLVAYDCRGHGDTVTENDSDLSLATLAQDLQDVIRAVYQETPLPDTFLIGHSMGGAVVTQVAYHRLIKSVAGLVVIDIVEGNAMAALGKIRQYCQTRPQRFRSVSQAIQWHLQARVITNPASARVSVPPLVSHVADQEEGYYGWKTPLMNSEAYWPGWFEGLTDKFLQARAPKLLMLAGPERLDTPMMIAQMQGKFQPIMFPDSGHAIQEDSPQRVTDALVEFWQRNRRMTLPPKVQITTA
ncbi:Protein phosphatase methylesterase 1 [Dimargaris xerosporica]|nr:Protein phosphatase methylesterase 1 [Dimargaris xerosporica]